MAAVHLGIFENKSCKTKSSFLTPSGVVLKAQEAVHVLYGPQDALERYFQLFLNHVRPWKAFWELETMHMASPVLRTTPDLTKVWWSEALGQVRHSLLRGTSPNLQFFLLGSLFLGQPGKISSTVCIYSIPSLLSSQEVTVSLLS